MTEVELDSLLRSYGWYLLIAKKYQARYVYAKKRDGKTVRTRYLGSESKLSELTEEEVLKRIQL